MVLYNNKILPKVCFIVGLFVILVVFSYMGLTTGFAVNENEDIYNKPIDTLQAGGTKVSKNLGVNVPLGVQEDLSRAKRNSMLRNPEKSATDTSKDELCISVLVSGTEYLSEGINAMGNSYLDWGTEKNPYYLRFGFVWARVENAKVTIKDQEGSLVSEGITNDGGNYKVCGLDQGRYNVEVEVNSPEVVGETNLITDHGEGPFLDAFRFLKPTVKSGWVSLIKEEGSAHAWFAFTYRLDDKNGIRKYRQREDK